MVLAAGLRAYHLHSLPLEQDELYTVHDAASLGAHAAGQGIVARPLYYLLQYVLLHILPVTPLALRLLPALFGLYGVYLTWVLGRRVFGDVAGLGAAWFVALAAWHVYVSQFARYYSLLYVLAALVLIWLPRAMDSGRRRDYLIASGILLVGSLTHPTFLFPVIGVVLALHLAGPDGAIRWQWPRRAAWLWLWGPYLLLLLGYLVVVRLTGHQGGLKNDAGRGLAVTTRVLLGMVQWLGAALAAASAAAMVSLVWSGRDRRWGLMALSGCITTVVLVFGLGRSNAVYPAYGTAMLPLVFVSLGGLFQRVEERLGPDAKRWLPALLIGFTAAILPETVSNMIDGTRYDYRPAYAYLARMGGHDLVIGEPVVIQR